jgi:predicted amidohydrolase
MAKLTAACVQLRSGLNRAANMDDTSALIRQAHAQGAQLIATPEMTNVVDINAKRLMADLPLENEAPELPTLSALAKELGIWLLVGSMAFKVADRQACNRCYLFDPGGEVVARYDKLHMFDVDLAGGESYRESKVYRRGERAVVVGTPAGKLGLSICYDLRFPHLYRALAQAGAEIITVPAAFTRQTGERHWHTLLQARAIENGAFVIAPAQGGRHEDGRETYGHSLIIHPSGQILAELDSDEPGIIVAEIDTGACQVARSSIPNLILETPFNVTNIDAMG